ncbi:hypothetical protein ALQ25_200113 [Pseudomonas coronafaciens pv. atropurpurea]|nr:hypothetical protein ALQ25_200113 [Pseudomonas coronafaciens pv. atropurpurea]
MGSSQQIRNPTVAVVRNLAKSPSPIMVFCFLMNCRSLIVEWGFTRTAGVRAYRDLQGTGPRALSGAVSAGGCDEPVPLHSRHRP